MYIKKKKKNPHAVILCIKSSRKQASKLGLETNHSKPMQLCKQNTNININVTWGINWDHTGDYHSEWKKPQTQQRGNTANTSFRAQMVGAEKCPWKWASELAVCFCGGPGRQHEFRPWLPNWVTPATAGPQAASSPHPYPLQRVRFSLNLFFHREWSGFKCPICGESPFHLLHCAQTKGLGFGFYTWLHASSLLPPGTEVSKLIFRGLDSKYFHRCQSYDVCRNCSVLLL